MSTDPTWALQVALVDRLRAALAPVKVYDTAAPQGAAYPYLIVYDVTAVPDDDKTTAGQALTFALHAWQRAEETDEVRGSFTPREILATCYEALHRQTLQVAGQAVYIMRLLNANTFPDADLHTSRGVARYRIMVHETE